MGVVMSRRLRTILQITIGLVLVIGLCVEEGTAQKRKRRTRRAKPAAPKPVITNPPIAPPATDATGDIKIISTADDPTNGQEAETTAAKKTKPTSTQSSEDVQRSIKTLSNQVDKLNEKLTEIQDDEREQREMERLTRAEQRAEQLRTQLLDVQTKMADLESRLEMVEYSMKPENIDKATTGAGSLRPEEIRETRKRQLENEKGRIQAQLKILETSKTRLEVSIATADSEVDQLRMKMEQRRIQLQATPTAPEAKPRKPDQP
jgi:chromosome segregation ATPase